VHVSPLQVYLGDRSGHIRVACSSSVPAPRLNNGPLYISDPWHNSADAVMSDFRAYNLALGHDQLQNIVSAKVGLDGPSSPVAVARPALTFVPFTSSPYVPKPVAVHHGHHHGHHGHHGHHHGHHGHHHHGGVTWQSFNFPSHHIHSSAVGTARISSSARSSFRMVSALNGRHGYVSFQSVHHPDHYLRHAGFILHLHPNSGNQLFKDDASFKIRHGMVGAGHGFVTFESSNYPHHYIRHQGFVLKLHRSDKSSLFHADASFKKVHA